MNISKKKYDEMVERIDALELNIHRLQVKLDAADKREKTLCDALHNRIIAEDSLMALNGLANAITKSLEMVYK